MSARRNVTRANLARNRGRISRGRRTGEDIARLSSRPASDPSPSPVAYAACPRAVRCHRLPRAVYRVYVCTTLRAVCQLIPRVPGIPIIARRVPLDARTGHLEGVRPPAFPVCNTNTRLCARRSAQLAQPPPSLTSLSNTTRCALLDWCGPPALPALLVRPSAPCGTLCTVPSQLLSPIVYSYASTQRRPRPGIALSDGGLTHALTHGRA